MTSPLVAITGPTASGKSGLAIDLAREFGGEIMNCDAMQVYRHFDIGTAKLPNEQRGGIPHHLIDVVEGSKGFTAGDYQRLGRVVLQEIRERGNVPFVVGGTGFYLRALLDGLSPAPGQNAELRRNLLAREQRRHGTLARILRRWDPAAARRIAARDVPKLIRAIEICILSSHSPSNPPPRERLQGFRVMKLGLFPPRPELYDRINERCVQMMEGGLIEEIEGILRWGIPRDAKALGALGYKQGLAVLEGRMSRKDALNVMQQDTRRYAKRQVTWFRHEPGMTALDGFGWDPAVLEQARAQIRSWLLTKEG
jgi:tRNA dimethylallyltransferase